MSHERVHRCSSDTFYFNLRYTNLVACSIIETVPFLIKEYMSYIMYELFHVDYVCLFVFVEAKLTRVRYAEILSL